MPGVAGAEHVPGVPGSPPFYRLLVCGVVNAPDWPPQAGHWFWALQKRGRAFSWNTPHARAPQRMRE